MKNKHKHTLETERLILRHFEMSDAEAMFQNWANDPDVVRFLPCDVCYNMEDTYKRIDRYVEYYEKIEPGLWELFVIQLKSTGELIGTVDYAEFNMNARSAEAGYQIGKAWWGQGYTTEAFKAMIKHCFETIGLKRIWADYNSLNPNSGKVMVKAGMQYEKTTLVTKEDSDETISKIQYGIMADDYFSKKTDAL